MKVTAQEEYGLRCLLQLVRNSNAPRPVTVREIAEKEGLSFAYAEKLLRILAKAGLAQSIRGVNGGYRLVGDPETLSVGDAIRALGSFLTHGQICLKYTGDEERCVHFRECGIRPVWSTINYHLQRLVDNMPLSLLLRSEREAREHMVGMIPPPSTQTMGGLS